MSSYNKLILLGNLTRDPQLSYLPNQTPVVEFGVATNRKWKSKDGQEKEEVCFIDCRMYGKRAKVIAEHFSKGKAILIEGRLQLDQWNAQDGSKRSKHRIVVEDFTFVYNTPGSEPREPREPELSDDDIPF